MAKKSTFISNLNVEVKSLATRSKGDPSKAFLVWLGIHIFELSEEESLEAASIDGANDKNIDLFFIDNEEGRVVIVQGKYNKNGNYHARINDVNAIQSSVNWLASPEALRREGKPELASAAEEYLEALKDGYGIELWYVYCGPKDANVEKEIAVYNQNPDNLDSRRRCVHYHLDVLERSFQESTGNVKRLDSEKISLLRKKHFEYDAEFGRALVATVPATELARLYASYGDALFERNVRLFLGAKKRSVNAEIANTLRSADKSNFWAYNNGLTFVCTDFQIKPGSVTVENFCIVNGCQSTRSLADQKDSLDSTVTALIRILAVSNDMVDNVIRYTNSQNPIRAWDLASQNKTQRRLKRDFDKLQKPYIYITRRGDKPTENLSRYKNGGRQRQIKLAEVAQYVAALAGWPVMAYKNKAFIFSKRHDDVFPPDIRAEEVLFAALCSEVVRDAVAARRQTANEAEERILIKGGPIFVMAVLGHVAKLRNGATYLKTMGEEQISSTAGRERFAKYAQYAVEAYLGATADALETLNEELTTAVRQPKFYEKLTGRVTRKFNTDKVAGERWVSKALPKLAQ